MYLFVKLLLPSASTRVFNLNSKQLVKLFSKIFSADLDEMTDHLNKGANIDFKNWQNLKFLTIIIPYKR